MAWPLGKVGARLLLLWICQRFDGQTHTERSGQKQHKKRARERDSVRVLRESSEAMLDR